MSVEILSRIQFAFTISFHYIYPPLSIGLGLVMVCMEGMYLKTGNKLYETMTKFYTRIFALIFGIGVATGIVMEFEFGTNWAVYSKYVGDVFGSALSAEGIFAFALESGFLGILLFGWNRVKPRTHFLATVMVTLGSMFSAIWIVVANSWQQTPAGFHIVGSGMDARAEITDFWAMVFNPSSIDRVLHVWVGAFLAGSFLVLSISAWYLLHKKYIEFAKSSFKIALVIAFLSSWAQLFIGDRSAKVVAHYQPAKLAAMEGHFDTSAPAPMYLFGWVDQQHEQTHGLSIPGGLSFLTYGDFHAPVQGLRATPIGDRPGQVNGVFQVYHLMITLGTLMILLTTVAAFWLRRDTLFDKPWVLRIFVWSVLLPQLANQAGWFTAEMGRQPWVVYGLLRTSAALSEAVKAGQVIFSLILFVLVYIGLFALFVFLLNRKITHGPNWAAEEMHSSMHRDMAEHFGPTGETAGH
ncbi:cytochrome ubiquinol oxidase subunit I [Dinghuibacter silviterrae]|uniref:Cytochrome bd-I ubiquinol oxidase subunit 1 apoprotein n=1 Tax=Dinghuibacter silviterrae TaxID=1539049 RepID=A0A4V3GLK7_9BACT|nr:cytochrome ubiquinol oxidase subunit I [Dinghuibacter silviterrae]TDW99902.1 cytochrome bd-I ubiquinol oxidase subunit 1 apoprotein [Dinghuibacter silviterrae]